MIEHWLMNITIDFKHHSKQPSTKSTYHWITYHFVLQKKKTTKHRRLQRSDTSATGRGGSPGGPSAAAVGPGWRWRSVAPGAGGTSGGWPRRVAGAVDANFWPWKCGWFGVDHGKTGIELWKMRMVSWKIGIFTMKNGDKSQSNIAISSSKIAIESDRKLRLNLWIGRSWLDIQNLWLASRLNGSCNCNSSCYVWEYHRPDIPYPLWIGIIGPILDQCCFGIVGNCNFWE